MSDGAELVGFAEACFALLDVLALPTVFAFVGGGGVVRLYVLSLLDEEEGVISVLVVAWLS